VTHLISGFTALSMGDFISRGRFLRAHLLSLTESDVRTAW